MKPATVISAPDRRGIAVAEYEKAAALMRSQPPSIFTTIISMAMIESSTSRPSAMMSEPSEMRSRFQPIASITIATTPSTSGTEMATIRPVRRPRLTRLTASTIASASISERSNSHTESFTVVGWSATRSISMPCGSSDCTFATASSTALPSSTTLPSSVITMPTISTSWPLWRIV